MQGGIQNEAATNTCETAKNVKRWIALSYHHSLRSIMKSADGTVVRLKQRGKKVETFYEGNRFIL